MCNKTGAIMGVQTRPKMCAECVSLVSFTLLQTIGVVPSQRNAIHRLVLLEINV